MRKCGLKARGRREGDNGTAGERMKGDSARKKLYVYEYVSGLEEEEDCLDLDLQICRLLRT